MEFHRDLWSTTVKKERTSDSFEKYKATYAFTGESMKASMTDDAR